MEPISLSSQETSTFLAHSHVLFTQGTTRRFSKGLDETSAARSGLRSTEKILASQRTASVQLKLDDDLQLLVRNIPSCCGLADYYVVQHPCCGLYQHACVCNDTSLNHPGLKVGPAQCHWWCCVADTASTPCRQWA